MKKSLLLTTLILCASLLLFGCGSKMTLKERVDAYYSAVNAQDIEKMKTFYAPSYDANSTLYVLNYIKAGGKATHSAVDIGSSQSVTFIEKNGDPLFNGDTHKWERGTDDNWYITQ